MKILITICARGGSKGVPGKNIKPINGAPLIAYTINTAKRLALLGDVCIGLSTDDAQIKEVASQFGITTSYLRPDELATDTAGKLPVIKHLMEYEEDRLGGKFDFIIDLDVTSPLRTVDDLKQAIQILQNNEKAVNLFSVNKAHKNPYFNMVEIQENGYYNLVKQGNFLSRQSAPIVYELNASFYIFKRAYFDSYQTAITPYSLIYEMPHICFDVDEVIDFAFLEYLIQNDKLDFEL